MKDAEAFICTWFRCPHCKAANSILYGHNYESHRTCIDCKKPVVLAQIIGNNISQLENDIKAFLSSEDIQVFAVEWNCDCGKKNYIFPKSETLGFETINEIPMALQKYEPPQYGLCEECFSEYNLEYPLPEEIEKIIKEEGN